MAAAQPPLTPLRLAWSTRLDGAAVYAQPLVAGGLVIVATEDDDVYGLDLHDGSVVWKVGTFQEIDHTTGRVIFSTTVARRVPVFASPSAAEGLLLVPTTAGLLAYSGPAGRRRPAPGGSLRERYSGGGNGPVVVRSRRVGDATPRPDDRSQPRRHRGPMARPRGAGRRPLRPAVHLLRAGPVVPPGRPGPDGGRCGKGDRVGIWSPNCPEWVALQYGSALIGAILVNVNPAYRTSELEYVLRQSGVRLLVSALRHRTSDYQAMVDEVRPMVPGLETVVYIDDPSWDDFEGAAASTSEADLAGAETQVSFDEPINIQYTSGSTGFPKGATLSHHNILNNGYFCAELLGYGEGDRVCLPVPFYHCFGMVMGNLGATTHGSTIVIPSPLFEPVAALEAVQQERCTSLYGVPTMFIAELSVEGFAKYDLTSLRTGLMAGSPCPVEVMKRVQTDMHMPEVGIAYGMTETSPVSTQTRYDDDLEHRTETVGRVMPHVEIKIVDPETGMVVPTGTPGEFCTRGYSVMLGYWNEPEKTAGAIDAGRWMHTGDLAVMREDGYVNIVGRIKDLVIRGGENIYPREVEEFLYNHPDIADVAVIGVPDAKYGEELVAWIKLRPGASQIDPAGLREFCRDRIAHHKIPRYVRLVDDFPMTVTGKIRKVEMRRISTEELGLTDAAGARTA